MSERIETPTEVHPTPEVASVEPIPGAGETEWPSEERAKRIMIIALAVFGILMIGLIVILVLLSINAYQATMAGTGPTPGSVVVSLLRDVAIILVAFETLIIGALLVILTIQVQALVTLLRDEIQPMLEMLNETVATVRGTTKFVSHNVVSPSIRAAGFLAGLGRMAREVANLTRISRRE